MSHGNIFVVDARTLIEKQKRISSAKGGILKRMESFNGIFHEGVGGHNGRKSLILAPQEIPDISGYQWGFGCQFVRAYITENPVTNQKIL